MKTINGEVVHITAYQNTDKNSVYATVNERFSGKLKYQTRPIVLSSDFDKKEFEDATHDVVYEAYEWLMDNADKDDDS